MPLELAETITNTFDAFQRARIHPLFTYYTALGKATEKEVWQAVEEAALWQSLSR